MCPLSGMSDKPGISNKEDKMDKRTFWVLIETEADRFDNPGIPDYSVIQDILRDEQNYGIVDVVDEEDVADIVLKPGK